LQGGTISKIDTVYLQDLSLRDRFLTACAEIVRTTGEAGVPVTPA